MAAVRSDVGRLWSRRAACFLWYFLSLRKKVLPPSGRQPHHPRRSRRVNPSSGKGGLRLRAPKRLSSGQTIGAVRTAVRSACCLPELRGANRLRRLCPLGDGELFKFYLKSSVCQRQTGLPKGNPPCAFPPVPAGVIGRRKGARIQWMQLPKAASDWQPSTETRIWHGSAKDDD